MTASLGGIGIEVVNEIGIFKSLCLFIIQPGYHGNHYTRKLSEIRQKQKRIFSKLVFTIAVYRRSDGLRQALKRFNWRLNIRVERNEHKSSLQHAGGVTLDK